MKFYTSCRLHYFYVKNQNKEANFSTNFPSKKQYLQKSVFCFYIILSIFFMYQVQKICGQRYNPILQRKEYLVKWFNYSTKDNTWQPEQNLGKCQGQIRKFKKSQEMQQINKKVKKSNSEQVYQGNQEENQISDEEPRAQKPRKRGRPLRSQVIENPTQKITRNTAEVQWKKDIKILAIGESSDGKRRFQIKIDGEVKWVERQFLFPLYSCELALFYESHLKIE